jgi:hypothetical protein
LIVEGLFGLGPVAKDADAPGDRQRADPEPE